MNMSEVRNLIDSMGGKRNYVINWEWATFEDEKKGLECFELIKDHCEHRGFNKAYPDNDNPNFHKASFRFR